MGCAKEQGHETATDKVYGQGDLKGLGTGVIEWVDLFMRQLERAQLASGFC
jgi:hypothetical protein